MKNTLSTYEAAGYLLADEYANWTRSGAFALVEYLEQIEEEGDEIEMDVVALRCEYAQWRSLEEWALDYFGSTEKMAKELQGDKYEESIRDYILENGELIEFDGGIIVSSF